MKQRLPALLLALAALVLLGGCALQPTYHYQRSADGGSYYSGQSPYGNADTVIYSNYYSSYPWGGYYGPGWGGIGFGARYTYRHHGDYRRWSRPRHQRHRKHQRDRRHAPRHHSSPRPANRPPPIKSAGKDDSR